MSVGSILSSGMRSMQASLNHATSASPQGGATEASGMAADMVGLRQSAIDAKPAANVVKAADGMQGTVIDQRA